MTGVLFTISVTGWGLALAILIVFVLGGYQAYLMMNLVNRGSGKTLVEGIHLIQGLEYKLRNGNKLKIVNVTAKGYHYTGQNYHGKEVKYQINGGEVLASMKSDLLTFLRQNVVTDEIVSED